MPWPKPACLILNFVPFHMSVTTYFLKRILMLLPVMLVVVTLVFFLIRLIPGDPVDFILGENADTSVRAELIKNLHFDEPILKQYTHYVGRVLHGDLGNSYFTGKAVTKQIAERYGATLELAFVSIGVAVLIALPWGIVSALKKGGAFDQGSLIFSLAGISVPGFYLGPVLALVFSIKLDLFPVSGRDLPGAIVLPSLTLGLAMAALLMRLTRAALLEVLDKDYVRTARAKGLSTFDVVVKHAFRTALIPVIAVLGLQFGTLLAGAVVTEKIFGWPGLGSLMLDAISKRDYAIVQGCVFVIAATYVIVNVITDLVYVVVDPRLRR